MWEGVTCDVSKGGHIKTKSILVLLCSNLKEESRVCTVLAEMLLNFVSLYAVYIYSIACPKPWSNKTMVCLGNTKVPKVLSSLELIHE